MPGLNGALAEVTFNARLARTELAGRYAVHGARGMPVRLRSGGTSAGPTAHGEGRRAPVVRDVTDWDDYAGRFEAVDAVEVRPRVSGMLESVHFRDGQNVKKGQLLFTIDPRPIAAQLAQSQAQLARAKAAQANADAAFRRGKMLSENHLISEADLELLSAAICRPPRMWKPRKPTFDPTR